MTKLNENLKSKFHSLFTYVNGKLYRKESRGNRKAGAVVDCSSYKGYVRVLVDSKRYFVHHVVWCMFYGKLPSLIDHINGDKQDNRIENLREVSNQENCANTVKPKKNNKLGVLGVVCLPSGKYRAQRTVKGVKYWSPLCTSIELASIEYNKLKNIYG